ncbi:conserved hypothetical protein [Theileria equi strain WA]|uniref:Inositol hexakisphosphate and diphosphoinositol-pentakisphosphate kinase n=1 Tax=Theileria equi strain WA TaxID=1537102 RepID=L1LE77_THEEQ|nr:conserved hypothetical protein [Theileria equi strain WA]EKX73732.1 conserved hypothetical protein [Theileria equi strain WA]|eukprot:XP_004833184.1 conserved hypothetical protein [Theileria equi strain WA]
MQRVFTLGICAMESKVESAPMQSILKLLEDTGDFKIIVFPEKIILNEPVSEWPIVECLIAFYSFKFPLEKAIEYVKLHRPVVLNDLEKQRVFRSRVDVYRELQACRIPHPNYVLVDHDAVKQGLHVFEEHYDYIVYDNVRINKPFIEKPVDADNHNNWIYYPRNAGGGCKKLFRKVQDRSSKYCADIHNVRRNGSYIYEEFMSTFGTDIKVYAVGCMFAHAEARKSPALDGKVSRYADGKEVRYPVILTSKEKTIAYRIVDHFGQTVCGFDILRTIDGPYVCDVNGWSFVKRNKKYHMDCSHIIRIMFLLKLEAKYNIILRNVIPARFVADETAEALRKTFADVAHRYKGNDTHEELCSVIVIMRHGDRKPKQKLKFVTENPKITSYFNNRQDEPQIKLKSPEEMSHIAEVNSSIIAELESKIGVLTNYSYKPGSLLKNNSFYSNPDVKKLLDELSNHKEFDKMLKLDDGFSGINRKVQLKVASLDETCVKQVLIVAKWGGELTSVGQSQAEDLGRRLRQSLYPTDSSGLIRLHSTYRHDFKIFSSDEGRCQITSAAFTKGILELEGELTPILVAMTIRNKKAHTLLNDNAQIEERTQCKNRLSTILKNWDNKERLEEILSQIEENGGQYYKSALEEIDFHMSDLERLYSHITDFICAIKREIKMWMTLYSVDEYASNVVGTLYSIHFRWKNLLDKFKRPDDPTFDFTKLADIVDNVRYDLIHHHFLLGHGLDVAFELYNIVQRLSSVISPSEYGVTPQEKLKIGVKIAWRLLEKIFHDVTFHKIYEDDVNRENDLHRNRDLLYATLVAPNTISKSKDIVRDKINSIIEGSCNTQNLTEYSKIELSGNNTPIISNINYEPTGAISSVAAASASAASVAATCLALSNVGINNSGFFKGSDKACCIGGIKPSEMFLCSSESRIEKLWNELEGEKTNAPCVINSSALWAHSNLERADSRSDITQGGAMAATDDGNLVRLEADEAAKLGIRSPYRIVRSRYYVTSASHLFAIFNFFKYAHYLDSGEADNTPSGVDDIKDLHYLSHIVLRVWRSEDKENNYVHRLEILVSSGAKDGFGQNYELLTKNAKSQKYKYKRHIQRFKINTTQCQLLCKRCRSSVNYSCLNDQILHTNDLIPHDSSKNNLKRSSSDGFLLKDCSTYSELSTKNDPLCDNTLEAESKYKSKEYLCEQCFRSAVLSNNSSVDFVNDISTAESAAEMLTPVTTRNLVGNSKNLRQGSNTLISRDNDGNIGTATNLEQFCVPPYCELSSLVVMDHDFELTKFENYLTKAFDKIMNMEISL